MRKVAFRFTAIVVCLSAIAVGAPAAGTELQAASGGAMASPTLLSAPMVPEQLEAIFISACFDGAAKLNVDQASPMSLAELPPDLRRRFGQPVSGQVWRLSSEAPSYLYTFSFRPGRTTSPKVCGLATQSINIAPAIRFLGQRVNGPSLGSLHDEFTGAQWLDAERGYVAVATKTDSFTVLEVKQLSSEQQRRALKTVPTLAIAPPVP